MTSPRDHALDGLRGIAAMMVVLSHVASLTRLPWLDHRPATAFEYLFWHLGAPAVDLFFTLSGYVVARSLLRTRQDYVAYLLSRAARLYPIAWTGVLAGVVLRLCHFTSVAGMTAGMAALSARIGAGDVIGFATLIAPTPDASLIDPPLWSIVVEMRAMLVMPILVAAMSRRPVLIAATAMAGILAAAWGLDSIQPLYFAGFIVGSLIAVAERRIPRSPRPWLLFAVGLAVLLERHVHGNDDPLIRLPAAIGAGLVILAIRDGACRRLLTRRAPAWLGRVSYPLYAVHYPIMAAFALAIGGAVGVHVAAVASIPFALAAAWFLTRMIDRPSIALSHLLKSRL